MNKYIYTAALLGAMTLASCQKEEAGIDFNSDPEAVKISATVGNSIFSRSNPTGDVDAQKAFNKNDKIGVSADAQAAVTYTFDGTKWIPEANTYLKWTQDAMNFTAYYPVTTGTDAKNFTLPTTQDTKETVADADYMTAAPVSKKKSDGDVSLDLSRQTARVIVKIAGFNNQYTDAQKYVSAVSLLTYATAYTDGAVTTVTTPTPIIPYCGNENEVKGGCGVGTTFTALVLPDAAHPDAEFIALTSGTGSDKLTVKGIPAHEAGKSYTYNVTVGKDQAKITGVTIADWGDGGTILPDGEEIGSTEPLPAAKVGDYYYSDGTFSTNIDETKTCVGIVFYTTESGDHGKVVSLDEKNDFAWTTIADYYTSFDTYASSTLDGTVNMAAVKKINNDYSDFPPFKWCADKSTDILKWYLPSSMELRQLFAATSGWKWVATGANADNKEINDWEDETMPSFEDFTSARADFNKVLTQLGGTVLNQSDEYLSSTQAGTSGVWTVFFGRGDTFNDNRDFISHARAILAF